MSEDMQAEMAMEESALEWWNGCLSSMTSSPLYLPPCLPLWGPQQPLCFSHALPCPLCFSSSSSSSSYQLVSVVNHHGSSIDSGHYTCFVKDRWVTSSHPPWKGGRKGWKEGREEGREHDHAHTSPLHLLPRHIPMTMTMPMPAHCTCCHVRSMPATYMYP